MKRLNLPGVFALCFFRKSSIQIRLHFKMSFIEFNRGQWTLLTPHGVAPVLPNASGPQTGDNLNFTLK